MASPEQTLEELLPEVANVFAIQESALFNCMSILSTTISRQEEENKSKATVGEIVQLRADVKKATEFATDSKKMIQRLEKTQERLLSELNELRQELAAKDTAVAALEHQHEQHLLTYEQHLEELDRRFDYVSRLKAEQKEVLKRLDIQERSYAEVKFGMAMLSKSIDDDSGEATSIVPLVPLVPVSGRNSPDHRSMKHIMSVAHLNSRRPTLATVAAITAATPGSVAKDLIDVVHDPTMRSMSRKASAAAYDVNDSTELSRSPELAVLVDVTAEVLSRQGSTLIKKTSITAMSPTSTPVAVLPSPMAETTVQTTSQVLGEPDKPLARGGSGGVQGPHAPAKLNDAALLDQVTQALIAPVVQSPPALANQDQEVAVDVVSGAGDETPQAPVVSPVQAQLPSEKDAQMPSEKDTMEGGLVVGADAMQTSSVTTPSLEEVVVGLTTVEAVDIAAPGALQRQESVHPASSPLVEAVAQPPTTSEEPIIAPAQILQDVGPSSSPPHSQRSADEKSAPLAAPEAAPPRKASVKSMAQPAAPDLAPAIDEARRDAPLSVERAEAIKIAMPVKQQTVKQVSAQPVDQVTEARRVSVAAAPSAPVVAGEEQPNELESPRERAMIRSHAEYRYLWHWAYSNISALYRMHGKQNVQQLLSGTKKDTVGSRVRQIEDSMDAVHENLQDMREKVAGLDAVQADLDSVKQGTTALADQVIDLRVVCSQAENTTLEVKGQLAHLEQVVQDFVQSFSTSQQAPPPTSSTPRPIEPTISVATFEALQAHVATMDKSLARLDPFMATMASAEEATKKELQAIVATQSTQAQVLEKELSKLADDGRKKAADHKRQVDDLATFVNAVVDRLYAWVHFLGDAIHLACSPDAPTDSGSYRMLVSVFRSKYTALGAKLHSLQTQNANPAADASITAVCRHVEGLAEVKDRDVDKYMASGMQSLALVLDSLVQSAADNATEGQRVAPLIRLVRETLVEAKGLACIAALFGRFGQVQTKSNTLAAALDETKAATGRQAKDIHELNLLHTVIKALSTKVEYVVNNTQMMIVEDDLKKAVSRLSDEREQLRVDVDASIKQLFAASSELEATLDREVTALAARLHTKIDRDEVGMAHQTMQEEIERLANDVVSHDEFVVLAERLKRKPDSNDIRAYVRQRISTLKLQQTDANTDAPLLGSVPVRCISCQNVVEAKAPPRDDKQQQQQQRDVLPFTTSSVRHVQKQKLEAMLRAKAGHK